MRIGLIIYSLSGHTWKVAEALRDCLAAAGHEVTLARVEVAGIASRATEDAPLKTLPSVAGYDAVVFGTPVRGGTIPSPMRRYLEQLPALQGMKVALLTTHFFRPDWGSQQVVTALQGACEAKGAAICGVADVKWSGFGRGRKIKAAVEKLCQLFQAAAG